MVGIKLDGKSVNMARKCGVAILLKESLPWLEVVRWFNHRFELSLKGAFQDIKSFQMIDKILMKIYYLYPNSPKRLIELKAFSNVLEEAVPKPAKVYGTRWIDHKFSAREILFSHYGTYITHI